MTSTDPIAYTYDADTHCPACAEARFGRCGGGFIACCVRDSEDNSVSAVFSWDEWCEPDEPGVHVLVCGTCLGVIREHDACVPLPSVYASEQDVYGHEFDLGGEA